MRALIAAGANVNANDEKTVSNTALAEVAGDCSLETATILIQAGPRITGWMQLNALHRAEDRKRGDGPAVYRLLLQAAEKLGGLG